MLAGLMRQSVEIYFKQETTDSSGATTFTWLPGGIGDIPADMRNVSRRKTDDNDIQPMGAETWECRLRARAVSNAQGIGIDYGDLIKFDGNFYEIVGMENVRSLNYELILTLERVEIA